VNQGDSNAEVFITNDMILDIIFYVNVTIYLQDSAVDGIADFLDIWH
jgi:hypothetical protein